MAQFPLSNLLDGTKTLATKIYNATGELFTPSNPGVVQLSGSIPEYGWVDGDIEPTPIGFAFGAKIDPATGSITSMYWNGSAWVEVV